MVADAHVVRRVNQLRAGAWARDGHFDDLGQFGFGAVGHQRDPVGEQDGLVHVVRDHEDGVACGVPHADELLLDAAARERVNLRERLVQQQHLRLDRERARDPDTLPHAAGKERRAFLLRAVEVHHVDVFLRRVADLLRRPAGVRLAHGDADVVEGGEPRHQRKALEHNHAVQAGLGDLAAFEDDATGAGLVEAGDDVQQGAFAAPGMTDHRKELAALNLEGDIAEDDEALAFFRLVIEDRIQLRDVINFEEGHTGFRLLCR